MAVRIVVAILLAIGVFFTAVGVIGVNRMPDVFGRLQASTCIATLGAICPMLAAVVYTVAGGGESVAVVKLALISLLVLLTNPASNHALCKAAYKMGIRPKKDLVADDYKEDDLQ